MYKELSAKILKNFVAIKHNLLPILLWVFNELKWNYIYINPNDNNILLGLIVCIEFDKSFIILSIYEHK